MSAWNGDRPLAKLIVLQRVREQAQREALAQAAAEEARAAQAERQAEEEHRRALGEVERADRALGEGGEAGEGMPAEVLLFESRFIRSMRRMAIRTELHKATVRGERITAAEAAARLGKEWERARRARQRFEERERERRRAWERERELREEAARDDLPPGAGEGDDDPSAGSG